MATTQMQTDVSTPQKNVDSSKKDWPDRWSHINKILDRRGPFTDPSFTTGHSDEIFLKNCKVLVIGAGGLGCEILKNLALTGFKDIEVIDMDTIDVSNLNRQFLFRPADVGSPKAKVAAEFIMKRVAGVKVSYYYGKIQDKDTAYYLKFQIIICGLDSVEARRWINATLLQAAQDDPEDVRPLVDGGTEGFKGQARVIIPTVTSCYECSLDMLNKPTTFPICTIANTPRLPEHCIEWAFVLQWPKLREGVKLDTDDPSHIQWIYETSLNRAKEFNIKGVTYSLTQGVVKNIIPAIASTNAVIAAYSYDPAACCNEAFKLVTTSQPYLNNYMMYTGNEGVYTYTFEHQKKPNCPVCGNQSVTLEVNRDYLVEDFIGYLQEDPEIQLRKPSLSMTNGFKKIYWQAPPNFEIQTRENLQKKLTEFINEGDEITVTDVTLPFSLQGGVFTENSPKSPRITSTNEELQPSPSIATQAKSIMNQQNSSQIPTNVDPSSAPSTPLIKNEFVAIQQSHLPIQLAPHTPQHIVQKIQQAQQLSPSLLHTPLRDDDSISASSTPQTTPSGSRPPVGSDEWNRQRRENHKEVERRRRDTINAGISELAKIVPGCEKNKGSILNRSVQYIQQLKENENTNIEKWELEKLLTDQAIQELQAQVELLKAENGRLREEIEELQNPTKKKQRTE
nr:2234_t:CDS:10 [Entrophospora candida]